MPGSFVGAVKRGPLQKFSESLHASSIVSLFFPERVMVNQNPRVLPFVQLDVFTSVPLEGNQLAVFTDARGLSDDEMQSLAREMNLAETTFILPRAATERERGVRVRIFTVTEELPFAGHPTLGTAMVLRGPSNGDLVSLDLNVGKIPVRFSERDGLPFGEMTQREPEFWKNPQPRGSGPRHRPDARRYRR
jgi:PhzF family phenazine biosynthesis protein